MSKKILVIEDWEKFQGQLDVALILNDEVKKTPRMIWEERLLKHELDVIEFGADKQKARAWDKLYEQCKVSAQIRGVSCNKNTPLSHMKELLFQEKEK